MGKAKEVRPDGRGTRRRRSMPAAGGGRVGEKRVEKVEDDEKGGIARGTEEDRGTAIGRRG